MANRPMKKYKSGNFSGVVWMNEKVVDGATVGFKTLTLTRSWKDKGGEMWRNENLNFRKSDFPKIMTIMHKLQEEIFLVEEEGDRK